MKDDYSCPVCRSALKAWADLDAQITFEISKKGHLTKRNIQNVYQTDGRCGIECSECTWEMHREELDDDSPLLKFADEAIRRQENIHVLTAK